VSYMYDMVVKDIKCFASVICVLTHGLVSEHQTVGYIFTSFVYSHAGAGARIMRACRARLIAANSKIDTAQLEK